MRNWLLLCFMLSVNVVQAASMLEWSDLRPSESAAAPHQVLQKVTPKQQLELQVVVNYYLTQADFLVTKPTRVVEAEQRLAADNVDVAAFLAQAKMMLTTDENNDNQPLQINPSIIDKEQSIPGFITPLEMDGMKITSFFFVPTAGACIHTPPPPANQIVYVEYKQGLTLDSLYQPYMIKGVLKAQQSELETSFSDGVTDVASSYSMQAIEITKIKSND